MAVFLTFSCGRDARLLPLWLQGIRRVEPDAQCVVAVDASDAAMPLPAGVLRLVTHFERAGNLNGLACIHGILSTIQRLAAMTSQPVVKMDSDTILTDSDWLEPIERGEADFWGFEGRNALCASGICYAMSEACASRLLEIVTRWAWSVYGLYEDVIISRLALQYLGDRARLRPWAGGVDILSFVPQHFGDGARLAQVRAAIHCGQGETLQAYGVDRTDIVARQMRHVLRILAGRCGNMPPSTQTAPPSLA